MLDLEPIKTRLRVAGEPTGWRWDEKLTTPDDATGEEFLIVNRTEYIAQAANSIDADIIAHAPDDIRALIAEVERLRAGIEKCATALQGLGHETPWKYGRELRALIEPVVAG